MFLEAVRNNGSYLSVLSYNQPITKANAIGVRRTLRSRSFKGYLKEEERDVRAAEKNEIITILEACTNCRDQVLILLTSELGFRIGEILGIDYTKDIDYETHEIRVNFREDNENDARAKMQKKEEDVSAMTPLNSCFITSENTGTSCKNRNICLSTSKGIRQENQ